MSEVSTASVTGSERSERVPVTPSVVELYQCHARFVWRRLQQMGVRPSDLEDALQEVFVVALRNLSEFDPLRAKPSTWLFGITINVARNFMRGSRRREAHLERDAEPQDAAGTHTPEDLYLHRQRQDRLAELLSELPIEHRTTFVLFELEGMTGVEIAEQMQVPEGTVRSRLFHARKHFEAALSKQREAESFAGAS